MYNFTTMEYAEQIYDMQNNGRDIATYLVLASVAQLDAPSNWRPGGHGVNPR